MIRHPIGNTELTPDMPVEVAARIVIGRNLEWIAEQLKLAAENFDEDVEHVHRLRVSTRRMIAALEVYRKFVSGKQRRKLLHRMKIIRRAAGKARDLDVLMLQQEQSGLSNSKLMKQLHRNREKAQQPIIRIYQKFLVGNRLELGRQAMDLDPVVHASQQPRLSGWSKKQLDSLVEVYFRQLVFDTANLKQLHRFRIATKNLRYSLDVIQPAFPAGAFDDVISALRQLQDLLGEINDSGQAIKRFRRMKSKGKKFDRNLLTAEKARLSSLKTQFSTWWTPQRAESMQQKFAANSRLADEAEVIASAE